MNKFWSYSEGINKVWLTYRLIFDSFVSSYSSKHIVYDINLKIDFSMMVPFIVLGTFMV